MLKTDESEPIPDYAARRWAAALVCVCTARKDISTVKEWSDALHAGHSTVRAWCRAAQISPKASLDCGRLVRLIIQSKCRETDLQSLLNIVDRRTVARLLKRAGIGDSLTSVPRSVRQFLATQACVRSDANRCALMKAIEGRFAPGDRESTAL